MVIAPAPILPQKKRLWRLRWGEKLLLSSLLLSSLCSRTNSWTFPSGGNLFPLKQCHPKYKSKTTTTQIIIHAGRECKEVLSVPAGCPNHGHRLVLVSFSSSLFIPLSPPRLKSEPSSPIGWAAWSCDQGVKTQNFKSMPAGFICLQPREERRKELVSTDNWWIGLNRNKLCCYQKFSSNKTTEK